MKNERTINQEENIAILQYETVPISNLQIHCSVDLE